MEIIKKKIPGKIYIPNEAKKLFSNRKICFFDIETTGFSRQKNSIILIGLLYYENNFVIIKQFFANTPKDEKLILSAFRDDIQNFECYVTYNGDAFDIPFLNNKFENLDCKFHLDKDKSVDLIKIVRPNKIKLGLTDCKLKSVEKALGLIRDDKISGKESVQLYKKYTKSQNNALKEKILKHNYDDIYNLPKLLNLFDKIDEKMNCDFTIPINDNFTNIKFSLNDITINGDVLSINGSTSKSNLIKQVYYGTNYTFVLDTHKGSFNFKFEIQNGCLSSDRKCLYVNNDDFSLSINTKDATKYNLPENIIIIKEQNALVYDNIAPLIQDMLHEIICNSITVSDK